MVVFAGRGGGGFYGFFFAVVVVLQWGDFMSMGVGVAGFVIVILLGLF